MQQLCIKISVKNKLFLLFPRHLSDRNLGPGKGPSPDRLVSYADTLSDYNLIYFPFHDM